MRIIAAFILLILLVSNIAFGDCVLQLQPREFRCDIELQYGNEVRDGLLVWSPFNGIEITAPGISFVDSTPGAGSYEFYYGYGLSEYRNVYGNDDDDFIDPTNPMWVDGEPAPGATSFSEWYRADLDFVTAGGNWDRNGVPITFLLPQTVPTAVPEPSSFLFLAAVGLIFAGYGRFKNGRRI